MSPRENQARSLERQIERLGRYLDRYQERSDQFVRWRGGVFIMGFALTFLAFQIADTVAALVALSWLVLWLILSRQHGRVKAMMRRFTLWREIKRGHQARMQLDWTGLPSAAAFDVPASHPFARDLDMIGERSLHHVLDTAISRGGSRRLLDWLLKRQPDISVAQARQAVVRDLMPLGAFRDRLTLAARLAAEAKPRQGRWDFERLRVWLAGQTHNPATIRWLIGLSALAAVNITLFMLTLAEIITTPLWAYTLTLYVFGLILATRNLGDLFGDALIMQDELRRLGAVLAHLETYEYGQRTRLAQVCDLFHAADHRPSQELRRAGWIAAGASLRGNPIVWFIVNVVVPWDLAFAVWLSRAQRDLAGRVPDWLEAFYDLEAYNALAAFAARHPSANFPTFNHDDSQGPLLRAVAIGHPLIHAETRVTNDFTLDHAGQVYILTGSNMSGKSSFLRTLGVNLQLAYAGSPVLAESLQAGQMRVFTSIRVSDSVQDGFSYFYAEVRRLKALLDALHDTDGPPLLFLIDEIFRGTNNRERLLGSRAYIRSLVGGKGAGLIATHDLDLVKLADEDADISNYHFREEVVDGRIVFDYRLRSGPCPTTNALKIMALEGLPVAGTAETAGD